LNRGDRHNKILSTPHIDNGNDSSNEKAAVEDEEGSSTSSSGWSSEDVVNGDGDIDQNERQALAIIEETALLLIKEREDNLRFPNGKWIPHYECLTG
ncbi:hypothetical protein PENTCL1PPCAC_27528, partial [Pristionchus entomophagus]